MPAPSNGQQHPVEVAVEVVDQAFNRGDLEAVLDCCENTAVVVVDPNGSLARGKVELRRFFERAIVGGGSAKQLKTRVIEADGIALFVSNWTYSGADRSGNPFMWQFTATSVFRKQRVDTPAADALLLLADRAAEASDKAEKQVAAFRANVESWYDSQMERANGWYKRKMQVWAVIVGLGLALVFNADTLHLVRSLWNDSALRTAITAQAGQQARSEETITPNEALAQLEMFPVGWQQANRERIHGAGVLLWLLGILLTAGAISAGSPFWFDVLNRLVNLRSAGAKPPPAASAGGRGTTSSTAAAGTS